MTFVVHGVDRRSRREKTFRVKATTPAEARQVAEKEIDVDYVREESTVDDQIPTSHASDVTLPYETPNAGSSVTDNSRSAAQHKNDNGDGSVDVVGGIIYGVIIFFGVMMILGGTLATFVQPLQGLLALVVGWLMLIFARLSAIRNDIMKLRRE